VKLERLHLRNFRCFEDITVDFGKRLTVIIADNGAGKTALLDAIAIGFGRYLTKLPGISGRTTRKTDLRVGVKERCEPFLWIAWEARTHDDQLLTWSSRRRRDASVTTAFIEKQLSEVQLGLERGQKEIDGFSLGLVEAEANQRPYFLPVVTYYGTNRTIREEVQRRRGFKKNFTRFDALAEALEPDSRFRAAFEWFNAMEDVQRREREAQRDFDYQHPDLQIVREAIERLLQGYKNPRTEIRPLRFVIDHVSPSGQVRTLRVSQLSDGYRVVLGVVMDLARRMMEANNHAVPVSMQERNPLDMPAIVLIDELDLHLHPRWQQRIVTDLMQTFTNTQFIVTTHSPQVLSTVKRENVRVIGTDSAGHIVVEQPLAATYGEPSGDVMHSVMLVDPQPPVAEKQDLQQLTEWVDQGRYQDDSAIRLMSQLTKTLGEQHPQLQRLRRSIQRQEALKR
jgi:predicted ATP-binding protein involved in virulence